MKMFLRMSDTTMKRVKYCTIGISIMLVSSILVSSQTFNFGKEALAEDAIVLNNDRVDAQSPGHFRGGHINWLSTGNPNEVEFNVINAFTRSDYGACTNPATLAVIACTGPGGFPGVGDVFIENRGVPLPGTELFFGDGTFFGNSLNTGALLYRVDTINTVDDYLVAHAIDRLAVDEKIRHTYPSPGPFTAEINDRSRNFVEQNNANRAYRISTTVDLSPPNDSPIVTFTPVVVCPLGPCTFAILVSEPNGDTLDFRLSSASEASDPSIDPVPFTQPGQAGNANDCDFPLAVSSTGTVTWDTTGCDVGLYSTSITIEEKSGGVPFGKVMIDFLIDIDAPTLSVTPPPSNGVTYNMIIGVTLELLVQCLDPNAGDTVTIGSSALPADGALSPSVPGNPASRIFTFSPIAVQNVSVTFTCVDNKGNAATPRTININVTPAPPRVVKTVHAEKHNFTTTIDGIPFIVDMTIIGEVYEDLNTQLVMKEQAIVVTCLKLPNQGIVHECEATFPPPDIVPVSNCMEIPFNGIHMMNSIVKGSSMTSISQEMNTVAKGFLVKTIKVDKEVFKCTFDNEDPADDVRVDVVLFTEIFENLSKIIQTPPQDTLIKTNFVSFRCVTLLETLEVQSCLFEQLFD